MRRFCFTWSTAGLAASLLLATLAGLPMHKLPAVFALTIGAAGAVVGCGLIALQALRRHGASLATQIALIAAVSATAGLAGVASVTWSMLVNGHDLVLPLVALPLTAGIALHFGASCAGRVAHELSELVALGDELSGSRAADGPAPGRLAGTSEVVAVAQGLRAAAISLSESRARERMLEANRRELVAHVSHDLRSPLTSLAVIAEALADGLLVEDEQRCYHDSLRANVARMTDLVNSLFELSQLDAGALTLDPQVVRADEVVLELLVEFEPLAAAKGVLLEASLPDLPLRLLAEGERLHRILNNIVHNAIRHTPSGGTVRVGVEPATNRTLITVQDSCGGIPEAHLHRVFDRLWRGERARTTAGAGLGLTIAAALAHLHGGSLSVRNHQPGCEFTLALPMPPTGNSPVLAQRDQNLSRPTVLPTLS